MSRAAIVVPVRLAIGMRVLQSTSRALDADGLFVRCSDPPRVGAQVGLRLYLPDGPPEDLTCTVVAERELRENGCRLKFTHLTAGQRGRLLRLIAPPMLEQQPASVPPPGAPSARVDLRALGRFAAQINVRFESADALASHLSLDISAGGMFVCIDAPPQVGDEVQLLFSLPGDAAPLVCRALVVRRIAQEEARSTGRAPGAGVQFIEANDSFRSRLDAWLARPDRSGS